MAVIFGGKEFARKIEVEIRDRVAGMVRKPKLVTIYNPENESGRVYTNIKEKKAREVGVEFIKYSIFNIQDSIKDLIINLNADKTVDGVMIQMPLGTNNDQLLIDLINLKKDVDGLRFESGVQPATVRAVLRILNTSRNKMGKVLVVGNKGLVGARLTEKLKCEGMDKEDFREGEIKNYDAVISCTGQVSLIHGYMIKQGVIAIDVGYPKGDFASDVAGKAAFITPVPGGVGPVTVACLFENLVELCGKLD